MIDFDRDLEATLRGRLAGGTLNTINDTLAKLEARVEDQVIAILRDPSKTLTPDQAVQAWYHKYAIYELRQQLNRLASTGQSAARRIEPKMEIGNAP